MKHSLRFLSILTASSALLAGPIGCEQVPEIDEADGDGGVGVSAERQHGPPAGRMHEALGLDEAQQEQATALREAMEAELQPIEAQLREKEEQLRAAWAAEAPDRAAILELGSQIDALHRAVRDRRTEHRVAMNALLTPEQRARRAEQGPGRGPRGERGRPGETGEERARGERRGPRPDVQGEPDEQGVGASPRIGRGRRAHGPGGAGAGAGGMGFGRGLTERLGLDEAQQPQVQALVDQMHQNAAPSREQMGELFEQERALWTAGQVDTRALGEINDRMDALMSAERERQVDFRLALIQLLTPEQRARLAEMPLAGGPRGMGHGPGRGMGRGMGPGYGAGHGPGADPGRE